MLIFEYLLTCLLSKIRRGFTMCMSFHAFLFSGSDLFAAVCFLLAVLLRSNQRYIPQYLLRNHALYTHGEVSACGRIEALLVREVGNSRLWELLMAGVVVVRMYTQRIERTALWDCAACKCKYRAGREESEVKNQTPQNSTITLHTRNKKQQIPSSILFLFIPLLVW